VLLCTAHERRYPVVADASARERPDLFVIGSVKTLASFGKTARHGLVPAKKGHQTRMNCTVGGAASTEKCTAPGAC
jgi:hypothetical protein